MATYNGENYIFEQIESILEQLGHDDEVIVVDDCSSDKTVKILEDLSDSRIKLYLNHRNKGFKTSFERAISHANNSFIFLSDQDDIWIKGRVSLMVKTLLDAGSFLVCSNWEFLNTDKKRIYWPLKGLRSSNSCKHLRNILGIFIGKMGYYGCTMAFQKNMVKVILPIPSFFESHDVWIALAGNVMGSIVHLDEKTLRKRLHNKNATPKRRSLFMKIRTRFIYGIAIGVLLLRVKRFYKA